MARGLQKMESQQKAQAAAKKGGSSTLGKDKGMKFQCSVCKQDIHNISDMKIHWSSKHPKSPAVTDEFAGMQKTAAK